MSVPQDAERWAGEPGKDAAEAGRSPYQRDRARVLHSAALRRLAAKTQVVGPQEDDFPRTRLTHSLECAQIGRELGTALGCDPDVVDAACLAHDLGHPPFGHNGEIALDAAGAACGGFEGNAQSLRILTRLEAKTLHPDGSSAGLNLTRAVLDAATKYPWPKGPASPKYGVYAEDLPVFHWLRAGTAPGRRCLEAQVMDWADDVAYSVHDLEDGVHAGHVPLVALREPGEQRELCELAAAAYSPAPVEQLQDALTGVLSRPWWPAGYDGGLGSQVALKRTTSELIARFCAAALDATRARYGPGPLSRYDADLIVPDRASAECAVLKAIAARYVMGRQGSEAARLVERELIEELVHMLSARAPDMLDPTLREAYAQAGNDATRLRVVIDAVASLTDISARALHRRLHTPGAVASVAGRRP